MPSGWDDGGERFADACEQQETGRRSTAAARRAEGGNTRASGPDEPTMRTPALDPELRRELDLVAALRGAAGSMPGPDADASARMRASLMEAIGGTTDVGSAAEGRTLTDVDGSAGGRGAGRAVDRTRAGRQASRPGDGRPERSATASGPGRAGRRRSRAGRWMNNVIAGTCVVMLLGALSVVLGRGALPGETLYGLKRASESVEMGLTGGQEAKGRKYLDFAALRLDEVSQLIERDTAATANGPVAAGPDASQAALIAENLRAFDEQARAGARLILPLAGQPSGPPRSVISNWAQERTSQLDSLSPSLQGDDRTAAASSRALLGRLSTRAGAVDERGCPTGSADEEFGALPASGRCEDDDEPRGERTRTSTPDETTSTSTSSRTGSPTSEDSTTDETTDETSTTTTSEEPLLDTGTEREAPDPVQVPMPVPLLPQVDVPPLLPGLPGIGLGG